MTTHFNAEMFGQAMGELIVEAVTPLKERIAELERRLAELEAAQGQATKGARGGGNG